MTYICNYIGTQSSEKPSSRRLKVAHILSILRSCYRNELNYVECEE